MNLAAAEEAAVVMAGLVGGLSWVAFVVSDDVAAMIEKLPEAARKLRLNLSAARSNHQTALQNMQEAANELQGAAADAGAKQGARVVAVRATEPAAWLRDYAVAQSALLFAVAAQTPIVLLLAYFLLASGAHFRRKLVQFVGPSLARKKDAVRILEEIDAQIQHYLFAMLVSNAMIGVVTWLVFRTLGLEHAGVWGVAAGVLHFVPYLGSLLVAIAAGVVGVACMAGVQSRFARVNAAILFIARLFFGWLWGIAGLLLGAPLVAIAKVICDRVASLKPAGELLGR